MGMGFIQKASEQLIKSQYATGELLEWNVGIPPPGWEPPFSSSKPASNLSSSEEEKGLTKGWQSELCVVLY